MVVHTRKDKKIINYYDTGDYDDDDDDEDYIPHESDEDVQDDYEMDEDLQNELAELKSDNSIYDTIVSGVISQGNITNSKKNVITSSEYIKFLERVEELDPDIYKFITSEYVKDKDKIRLCELYTILISREPFSIEWIELRSLMKHEIKQISRKMCFFKETDPTVLEDKFIEFKRVKNHFDTPLKEKIILLNASLETKSAIYAKYKELSEYSVGDNEYAKLYTWLQYALNVPYNITKPLNITSDNICDFLNTVYNKLNQEFYGLQKVKEQILLFLNMKLTNPHSKNYNLALLGSKGVGKCFTKDTPILMSDLSVKNVQEIRIGDTVMGKDGMPRTVKALIKGFDKVYTISQKYSDMYTVCRGHMLVLRCIKSVNWFTKKFYSIDCKVGDMVKIPVEKFHSLPRYLQKQFVSIHVPIEYTNYNSSDFDIDPFLLGMWYGGNDTTSTMFIISPKLLRILGICSTKFESEIVKISEMGDKDVYMLRPLKLSSSDNNDTSITKNSFLYKLKQYNLWGRWSIPSKYTKASVIDRCRFIAGFLDVNGIVVNRGIKCCLNGSKEFAKQLVDMIRSVGLYCTLSANYEILTVVGKFSILPLVVHTDINDVLIINNIKTSQTRWDFYYGFEIDNDHLFLLGDYTLVHNCFAENTPIQLYDMSVKNVQDVVPGDLLMGDDYLPRLVTTTTTGIEKMYTIKQTNGMTYIVNESHILSLILHKYNRIQKGNVSADEYDTYRIFHLNKLNQICYFDIIDSSNVYHDVDYSHNVYYIDITVLDYLELSNNIRPFLKGYKKPSRISVYNLNEMESNISNGIVYGMVQMMKSTFKLPKELAYLSLPFVQVYKNKYYNLYNIQFKQVNHNPSKYFLAGILISHLEFVNYTWTIKDVCMYNYLYHQLNINVLHALKNMSPLQLIQRLICHDPFLDSFGFESELLVEFKSIDTYYGFTLDDASPNRRFLLCDGTVVHNTHISRTLANIMDFPFEQISMGNVTNPEILTGHQYTYVGSRPGAIVNALVTSKYNNVIIFLDEFDKVQNMDVSNALLHIIDTTQNHQFVDNYLGQHIYIDLSNIWFIFAMNAVPESGPLKDRVFVIEIDGYTFNEKCIITRDYLLPRVCKNAGINKQDIIIDEDTVRYLVNKFTTQDEMDNNGVRYIEKKLGDFVNKIVFLVNTGSCFTDLSFSIQQKLSYPVQVSRKLIDSLLINANKIQPQPYTLMYT